MTAFLAPARWLLVAIVVSAAMLATAHGFETFAHLPPCELCLRQREVYWTALGVAAAGIVAQRLWPRTGLTSLTCWALALVFLAGAAVAAYHAGVEWKWWPGPTACSGGSHRHLSAADMTSVLSGAKQNFVRCDVAAWRMFGLSMAGWNALMSLGLAGASVIAAMRRR
jgi:disulfide bond formation protein DsbB